MARHRFARQRGGVKLAFAFLDDAVDGYALAGFHHDDAAHGNIVGVDLAQFAVALYVRAIGGNVHHCGDVLARFADGVALEQLAYLVKQHDGAAFGHRGFRVGERDHGERADGGHSHEEVLVEHLAGFDVRCRAQ